MDKNLVVMANSIESHQFFSSRWNLNNPERGKAKKKLYFWLTSSFNFSSVQPYPFLFSIKVRNDSFFSQWEVSYGSVIFGGGIYENAILIGQKRQNVL